MSTLSKSGPCLQAMQGERDGPTCHAAPASAPAAGFACPPGGAARGGYNVEQQVLAPINRIVARLQRISNEMREVEQRFRETMQRVAFDRVASDRFASDRVALDRFALDVPAAQLAMRDTEHGADASLNEDRDPAGQYAAERFDRSLAAVTDRVTATSWHMCEVTRELVMLQGRVASALRGGKSGE